MGLREEYMTISESAKEVGVTRQTISRWIREGKISAEKYGREMFIEKEAFGKTHDGALVDLYTLSNSNRMEVKITNYGGIVVSIKVPDRQGVMSALIFFSEQTRHVYSVRWCPSCRPGLLQVISYYR